MPTIGDVKPCAKPILEEMRLIHETDLAPSAHPRVVAPRRSWIADRSPLSACADPLPVTSDGVDAAADRTADWVEAAGGRTLPEGL